MSSATQVRAIVAMNELRVIGRDGALPWKNAEDMAYFKRMTSGHVVIMGRKTWQSLPAAFRPLPGRLNIIVSREPSKLDVDEGVLVCGSPEEAVRLGKQAATAEQRLWIIGGAGIYAATLTFCDEVYLTLIPDRSEGDAHLLPFEQDFDVIRETEGATCRFVVYARRER